MGSESKSRKRRSSPLSDDGDDSGRKRGKRDDRERKVRKSEGTDKKKEKLKEKKHKRKRSRRDHDSFEELSKDDYYSKNNEFSAWLKEEKGIFFSDLSSEDARKLFSKFVKDWNRGKLQSQYYEGIVSGPRTAHNWKIRPEKKNS
ncbi:hypothetical protein QJS10_CPA06g00186 [Acorus calamus]|uniref:Uncharacterized protein n=1 Tax=Acorus calamus TaxID=4465 RepID=A0AAV9EMZ6_ACOCL|nr:hypothetical protein QJS10_CPA06g00186 [Acorus calamus]